MKVFHFLFSVLLIVVIFFLGQKLIENIKEDAIKQASERLVLTRDIRIAQLKNEVKTMYSEVRFWAESKPLSEGLEEMLFAWSELSSDPKAKARELYITNNPLFPGYTADYNKADDGSHYSEMHEKLHRLIKGLTQQRGYYDVYLIANNGDVVYSVYKEDDFATNLISGKYKETSFAQGFREVQDNTNLNHVSLMDFKAYVPSKGVPASFIQTSITNKNNKTIGILAFQLPIDPLDKVISSKAGLAKSTKIIAVGADHLIRNRIDNKRVVLQVDDAAIKSGLKGETGVGVLEDYNGRKMISAYAPFELSQHVFGNTSKNIWSIVVKQKLSDVLKPVKEKIKQWLFILSVLGFISLLFAWFVTREKGELSTTE